MFDVGFLELALISMVALIVVGPERLPALARTTGLWIGKIRRLAQNFRMELEREVEISELKSLRENVELPDLRDLVEPAAAPRSNPVVADSPLEPGSTSGSTSGSMPESDLDSKAGPDPELESGESAEVKDG